MPGRLRRYAENEQNDFDPDCSSTISCDPGSLNGVRASLPFPWTRASLLARMSKLVLLQGAVTWYELHKQHLVELLRAGEDAQALGVTHCA